MNVPLDCSDSKALQPGREVLADRFALHRRAGLGHDLTDDSFDHAPGLFLGQIPSAGLVLDALNSSADAFRFPLVAGERGLGAPLPVAVCIVAEPIWARRGSVNGSYERPTTMAYNVQACQGRS